MDGWLGWCVSWDLMRWGRVISCEGVFVNDQWVYVFSSPFLGGVVDWRGGRWGKGLTYSRS